MDLVKGVIPVPTDLLRNPMTGTLAIPTSDADTSLTKEVKEDLSLLDGWPANSTITLPFDGPLDPKSLSPETAFLVDIKTDADGKLHAARVPPDSYWVLYNTGKVPATSPPYLITVRTQAVPMSQPKDLELGHQYAMVVTTDAKDPEGHPLIGSVVGELLQLKTPLMDSAGRPTTFLGDPAAVATLEAARKSYYQRAYDGLEATGVPRDTIAALTTFTVQKAGRFIFDPNPLLSHLPAPIDIGATAGAPIDTEIQFEVSEPCDVASAPGNVVLFRKSGEEFTPVPISVTAPTASESAAAFPVKIKPTQLLAPSTTYLVVVKHGFKNTRGIPIEPSSFFTLVRATSPLVDRTATPAKPLSPYVDLSLDVLLVLGTDPTTATATDWETAQATLAMTLTGVDDIRTTYAKWFVQMEKLGIQRRSIVALWSFDTAKAQGE